MGIAAAAGTMYTLKRKILHVYACVHIAYKPYTRRKGGGPAGQGVPAILKDDSSRGINSDCKLTR